jgi:hypothetical protein
MGTTMVAKWVPAFAWWECRIGGEIVAIASREDRVRKHAAFWHARIVWN